MEECQFCQRGEELQKVCGKLHSVVNETCHCVAHHRCMQFSSNLEQFNFQSFGGFYIEDVEREIKRGQKLKCSVCKRKGATAGCAFKTCKQTYHYPCAQEVGDIRVCRLVKYVSQDVDPKSTVVMFCIFCSTVHKDIYTKNLSLASEDELWPNSEDCTERGPTENSLRCTTEVDLLQQRFPSSSSSTDRYYTNECNGQVDRSDCVIGDMPFPFTMDINTNSVGTSSTLEKNAEGNVAILDAAVSGTPSVVAQRVDQNDVDATPRSECRRDRLCLKSSQRKRKARQMECENAEASQVKPLLEGEEVLEPCLNWNESNKHATVEASAETRAEVTGINKSSINTGIGVCNGRIGESGIDNEFLLCLDDIPDPLADEFHLKQPGNLPDICLSSSRMRSQKKSNPGRSQPLITSFLTPDKKLGMNVTENGTIKVAKEKPKAQRQLKLSGRRAKSVETVTQTQLVNKAEKCQRDFNPVTLHTLPTDEVNVSLVEEIIVPPIERMNILPIAETNVSTIEDLTFLPVAGIVSAAREIIVPSVEGAMVQFKKTPDASAIIELDLSPGTPKQTLPNAGRNLLLVGSGNYTLVTENKPLRDSLSDSSSDARDDTESNGNDCNDRDEDSSSAALSPSYEDLSSTLLLHQPEDYTSVDQVCGLCIPVVTESVDDRTSKGLLKHAICSLDLVEENVFLWQVTGLNEIQILNIVLQFTRHLRDQKELELVKKLFEQKRFDADSVLENSASTAVENVELIQQEIKQNFSEAEKKYGRSVGQLCIIEDLRISAAFIILSNTNDRTNAARSSLPKTHRVHICSKAAEFVIFHNLCDTQRMIISDNEYENLKWWLETFEYSTVLVYPTEKILQSSNSASVTNRLRHYFTQRTAPGGNTSFVFIQRTNPDLLIYRPFVCKMLAFVKEELLTCNHDAIIVFDIGRDLMMARFADAVMPCLLEDEGNGDGYCFEVEVFTGTNPVYSPVSCLVVHLLLTISENC